mgnify:CR=1 FL=1
MLVLNVIILIGVVAASVDMVVVSVVACEVSALPVANVITWIGVVVVVATVAPVDIVVISVVPVEILPSVAITVVVVSPATFEGALPWFGRYALPRPMPCGLPPFSFPGTISLASGSLVEQPVWLRPLQGPTKSKM